MKKKHKRVTCLSIRKRFGLYISKKKKKNQRKRELNKTFVAVSQRTGCHARPGHHPELPRVRPRPWRRSKHKTPTLLAAHKSSFLFSLTFSRPSMKIKSNKLLSEAAVEFLGAHHSSLISFVVVVVFPTASHPLQALEPIKYSRERERQGDGKNQYAIKRGGGGSTVLCVLSRETNPSNSALSGLESGTSSALLNGWSLYWCNPAIYDTHTQRREREGDWKKRKEKKKKALIVVVVWAGVMFAPSDFTRHLRPIVPHGSVRPPQSGNNWLSTNKITTDKRVDPRLRDYSADVQDSIFLPGGTAAASSAACAQSTVFRGVRWTRMRFLPPSLPLPPLCVEEVAFGTRTQGGLMPPANRKKKKRKTPQSPAFSFLAPFVVRLITKLEACLGPRKRSDRTPNPQRHFSFPFLCHPTLWL